MLIIDKFHFNALVICWAHSNHSKHLTGYITLTPSPQKWYFYILWSRCYNKCWQHKHGVCYIHRCLILRGLWLLRLKLWLNSTHNLLFFYPIILLHTQLLEWSVVCLSVHLSETKCIVAKWYIFQQKCLKSEQVNRKCPWEHDFTTNPGGGLVV